MRFVRQPGRLAAFLALVCVAMQAGATTVRPMNIIDLIDNSETIVAGRVEQVTDGFAPGGIPYTEVTVQVYERYRGAPDSTFTFRQFGLTGPRARPGGKVYFGGRPEGWPAWKVGEISLLFLYPQARVTGFRTTVGLGYGKLGMGNGVAVNGYNNAGLFSNTGVDRSTLSADEQRMFDAKNGPVNADALRTFLRRTVNARPTPASRHADL